MELKSCSFHCLLVWSGGLLMDYLNFEHLLLEKANVSISEMHCNNSKSSKGPVGDAQLLAAHVHQDENRLVPVNTLLPPFCKEKTKTKLILKKLFILFCFFGLADSKSLTESFTNTNLTFILHWSFYFCIDHSLELNQQSTP